jgi:hypothetical protein
MEHSSIVQLRPRARVTGTVYLFYFLTAVFGAFLDSRHLVVYSYLVNAISVALYIAVTLLFYYLFKPVNRSVSLIAAFFSLLGCIFTAFSLFNITALSTISPLVFFGPFCMLIGYLILRSNFLPGILGVLMILAGIGWLAYLSPLGNYLSLYIKILGILAEASLMLWLIVMGVNARRWKEQAGVIG